MPTLPIPVFVSLVLAFAALRLWQKQNGRSPLTVLLAVCALQCLIIALSHHYQLASMRIVQPITASLIPPTAWLVFQTTAVRSLRFTDLQHALAPVTVTITALTAPEFLDLLLPCLFIAYALLILRQSVRGPDAQPMAFLSHGEIPSRLWLFIGTFLVVSALNDVLIVVAFAYGFHDLVPWFITVFSVGSLLAIGALSSSPQLQTDRPSNPPTPLPDHQPDTATLEKLTSYMAERQPYLDPDLTLAKLSRKLGISAKTLSMTINAATGENVSRFINKARIEAAQKFMLDGMNITNAMLASGFNTKSNFNREFQRIVGRSPSEWLNLSNK